MSVGLLLKCLELDLPRPDALFLFYPSLLCEMFPSPSRLICLIDPMVMFPFLMRCQSLAVRLFFQAVPLAYALG